MKRLSYFLLFLIVIGATRASAQDSPAVPSDSYLDSSAAELVRLARARRQVADLSVERYKALSKERISVGLRGIRRDRLLYRREVAGRLDWTRDGEASIEILGARESIPVAVRGVQIPDDLHSFMPHLAFDPADNRLLIGWGDNEFVRHPLAPNAERYYKYRTGGTTTINLAENRIVRLVELEIIPRQTDPHNISGSFWLDVATHSVVQASFRLARDIDIVRDLDEKDDDDMPRFLKPLKAGVDFVTIEYGLYDLKWWMPRLVVFEGAVRAGVVRMPMQYERTYSQYEIVGRAQPLTMSIAEVLQRDSARLAADKCEMKGGIRVQIGGGARTPKAGATPTSCGRWQIIMPADSATLLTSPELPPDAFATGEQLITEGELRELSDRIEKLKGGPAMLPQAITDFGLLPLTSMRYNRVEALSVAANGDVDFGAYRIGATARIGVADLEPNFELAVERPGENMALTLNGYRRLNGMDPFARPFSLGSSLSALLFGRDEADYYRTRGVELRGEPSGARARWYNWRLFAQKESAAEKETDFSLRHLLNESHEFRTNLVADEINAYGGELTLRAQHGIDPDGFRIGAELFGHGATGTSDFGRGALTLRTGFPLPGAFSGALEAAAGGTSVGAPLQHRWYIGGPTTLRGYNVATLAGETFWRGRAEIGYGLPAVRLVGFSDAGWAGSRDDFTKSKPLMSVGGGVSFLDGILRFDVARGLRAPKGWTATLYFDAAL